MKSLILIIFSILSYSAYASSNISCYAEISVFSNNTPTQDKITLETAYNDQANIKYEGEISDTYFSASVDLQSKSLTLIMSFGPNYTSGILAKGWFNQNGEFKATKVEEQQVYMITCYNK